MSLSLRFILPLFVALSLISWASISVVEKLTESWFIRDIETRSRLIASTLSEPIDAAFESRTEQGAKEKILDIFHRSTQDERLFAVALCREGDRTPFARTLDFPAIVNCSGDVLPQGKLSTVMPYRQAPIHISFNRISAAGKPATLVLVHDLSFMSRRSSGCKPILS